MLVKDNGLGTDNSIGGRYPRIKLPKASDTIGALLLFEKSFNEQRFSVTLELRTRDIKGLFKALEIARMSHIKF
jgi:hypothetical protein